MKEKKKYVNYVALIGLYGLDRDFDRYCKNHKSLSLRRNARNYLLKSGHYNDLKAWREVGFSGSIDDLVEIAKTRWIDPVPMKRF